MSPEVGQLCKNGKSSLWPPPQTSWWATAWSPSASLSLLTTRSGSSSCPSSRATTYSTHTSCHGSTLSSSPWSPGCCCCCLWGYSLLSSHGRTGSRQRNQPERARGRAGAPRSPRGNFAVAVSSTGPSNAGKSLGNRSTRFSGPFGCSRCFLCIGDQSYRTFLLFEHLQNILSCTRLSV